MHNRINKRGWCGPEVCKQGTYQTVIQPASAYGPFAALRRFGKPAQLLWYDVELAPAGADAEGAAAALRGEGAAELAGAEGAGEPARRRLCRELGLPRRGRERRLALGHLLLPDEGRPAPRQQGRSRPGDDGPRPRPL